MAEEKINLEALEKAIKSLKEAVLTEVKGTVMNELRRDAIIQRFEYTYELAWKTLKRVLKEKFNIQEMLTVKETYREAGKHGIIDNVEKWFDYQKARNLTSHTYDENTANLTLKQVKLFIKDVEKLSKNLKNLL